jgi:stringent starvation protein B
MTTTSPRPYIVRAFYEWICDNDLTPYLLVNTAYGPMEVPRNSVRDGKIVLNISPSAVRDLSLGNEVILCRARFGGRIWDIHVPIQAVEAIYAKENGQGMVFPEEPKAAGEGEAAAAAAAAPERTGPTPVAGPGDRPKDGPTKPGHKKPRLTVIK